MCRRIQGVAEIWEMRVPILMVLMEPTRSIKFALMVVPFAAPIETNSIHFVNGCFDDALPHHAGWKSLLDLTPMAQIALSNKPYNVRYSLDQ